ncbi:MAG: tetratricopeptide repeat protein [Pseudomonadota bacterium]
MAKSLDRSRVEPDDIREELDRVLDSETFARSERARGMLSYVVEQELAGKGDLLKGFAIAQDVFGRSDDFDPAMDAVVRVQAGRLRDQLTNYYEGEGKTNPVSITIPRGTYVPQFAYRQEEAADTETVSKQVDTLNFDEVKPSTPISSLKAAPVRIEPDTPVSPFVVRNLQRIWVAVASILTLLLVILGVLWGFRNQLPPDLSALNDAERFVTNAEGLPTATILVADQNDATLDEIAADLRGGATRFQTVRIREPNGAASSPGVDYAIAVARRPDGLITASLRHQPSRELIWEDEVDAASQAEVAGVLTTLLPEDGVLYRDAEVRENLSDAGLCLSRVAEFFALQSATQFSEALACVDEQIASDEMNALMHAQRANLIVEGDRNRYERGAFLSIEDALQSANRAVDLQPLLPQSHRALGNVLLARGDLPPAVDAFQRAYDLNPFDLSLVASYGFALYQADECAQAVGFLDQATGSVIGHPSWWDYTKFLCAFDVNDRETMAAAAIGLARFDRSYYVAARAISAHLNGDFRLQETLIERLSQMNTGLTRDPFSYYDRFLPERLATRMADALVAAGFVGSVSGE